MKYNKNFNDLVDNSIKHNQYVGLGYPNAKILFIGKEPGMLSESKITDGSAYSWKENDYSKRFFPKEENVKKHSHTWQKYQKLHDQILNGLEIKTTPEKKDFEITFVENVFTTELSNLAAPTTNEAKQLHGFQTELEKRKEHFWNSEFIKNFPVILITASDNNYIETYQGEVCALFEVDFYEEINCGKSNKLWVHYSNNEKPKIVIHTRQLTNGASNKLFNEITKLIVDFINKESIKIK